MMLPCGMISWSDQPCHIRILPPLFRNADRSGVSLAIIGLTICIDCLKNAS